MFRRVNILGEQVGYANPSELNAHWLSTGYKAVCEFWLFVSGGTGD
jgi:hypothetical protein